MTGTRKRSKFSERGSGSEMGSDTTSIFHGVFSQVKTVHLLGEWSPQVRSSFRGLIGVIFPHAYCFTVYLCIEFLELK